MKAGAQLAFGQFQHFLLEQGHVLVMLRQRWESCTALTRIKPKSSLIWNQDWRSYSPSQAQHAWWSGGVAECGGSGLVQWGLHQHCWGHLFLVPDIFKARWGYRAGFQRQTVTGVAKLGGGAGALQVKMYYAISKGDIDKYGGSSMLLVWLKALPYLQALASSMAKAN